MSDSYLACMVAQLADQTGKVLNLDLDLFIRDFDNLKTKYKVTIPYEADEHK
jgi:hypothetical protein